MSESDSATSNGLHADFQQIMQNGRERIHRPEEARAWITSFGNFQPGTEVSTNLLTSGPKSFLPILTSWLRSWFQRTQDERKQARLANVADGREKNMTMQYHRVRLGDDSMAQVKSEEGSLEWLFGYIFDYLGLDHNNLTPSDLRHLCEVLLHICMSTTIFEDIEQSTNVIHRMLQRWSFPEGALEPALEVLCYTRTALSRSMPTHLVDCITLLVTGNLSHVSMRYLLAFIKNVGTEETSKKSTVLARGSILFLGDLASEENNNGVSLVQYTDLVQPLQVASGKGVMRLSTDILELCYTMMRVHSMLTTMLARLESFIAIVESCAVVPKAKAAIRLTPQLAMTYNITVVDDDPHQQANLAATARVKQELITLWKGSRLTENDQLLVYRFCMDTPDDTDETTLMFLLEFAEHHQLCHHVAPGGEAETLRIVRNLVQNNAMSRSVRNKAIDVVHPDNQGQQAPDSVPDLPSESSNDTDSTPVVDALLEAYQIEDDPALSRNIAHCLQQTFIQSPKAKSAQKVITGFEALVLHDEEAADKSHTIISSVEALINITLRAPSATASFNALLRFASVDCKSTEARIVALRFLFRLRRDSRRRLYVQGHEESRHIAAALCRTREAADSFAYAENPDHKRKSGSSTSLSITSNTTTSGWIYPDTESFDKSQQFTNVILAAGYQDNSHSVLDMRPWLITMAECLQRDQDWETYSYLLVHAGAQLANTMLFSGSNQILETVVKFRQVLCERISLGKLLKPPISTGLKDSDVAICLFNILTALIPYATMKAGPIQKAFADDLVKTFLTGIGGSWEGTSRGCIHALSICCLEMPASVASSYPTIVDRISKNMTQSHLSMHFLEFLAQIARLPAVHSNFQDDEVMMIFGICIQFLERARERPTAHLTAGTPRTGGLAARQTGLSSRRPPYRAQMLVDLGLSHYNSALVYHVMIFWFLSLKLSVRARAVRWIVPRLVFKDRQNEEQADEQAMVFIDMMQRTAYSDLGETGPHPHFAAAEDGKISSASWIVAQSIVTIETAGHTGLTQITKRQSSGTTHAVYQQHTLELPAHHVPMTTGILPDENDLSGTIEMLPSHVLLQMAATADPVSFRKQPVLLPKDDVTRRAIESFDRLVTVDSHKLGIMYIGQDQVLEKDYLPNTSGSPDYTKFLDGMGTRVSLSPPLRFNPQGLQYGIDGNETYAWRDRVTEIVFHITTMMPTKTSDDPASMQKKSHVGNCHVNIIYNRSGLPWDFKNFSSQFNYVNIVVEPANRTSPSCTNIEFYRVHTLTAPQFPPISPASDPKIISAAQLPQFVRLVALNADVFCQAWDVRDSDTEFPSSWRARLQAIKRLREKVLSKEKGSLAQQLDFAGFTLA